MSKSTYLINLSLIGNMYLQKLGIDSNPAAFDILTSISQNTTHFQKSYNAIVIYFPLSCDYIEVCPTFSALVGIFTVGLYPTLLELCVEATFPGKKL